MARVYTPQWMKRYLIHGHDGSNGSERVPHVHVYVGDGEASVSIEDASYLRNSGIPHNRYYDVLEWVRDHRYELKDEWNSKSNT